MKVKIEFVHAPECGWCMTAYGKVVTLWEDGSFNVHEV